MKRPFQNSTEKIVTNSGCSNTNCFSCAIQKKCGQWDKEPYTAMWNGNTLVETAGDANGLFKDRFSPVMIELRQKTRKQVVFWTASDYNNSGCHAYNVRTDNGKIGPYWRSHPYVVLCK